MLLLISPAKTLDEDSPIAAAVHRQSTEPLFVDDAAALIATLRRKSAAQVAELMGLSQALADLNVSRYRSWSTDSDAATARPAALLFDGDVYDGLDARTLKAADWRWAQEHLVILSGLYGALRPLDRIQPHRLEMGTALATRGARDLYGFWGERIAAHLAERLATVPRGTERVVVNLASVEYARAALVPRLDARVVECVFEDWKTDRYKVISFFAKRARGLMARWAIEHRVRRAKALVGFDADGYAYDGAVSTDDRLVFRRRQG